MDYIGVFPPQPPGGELRELERERERQRQIREARAARRAERPSRFATLAARVRHALQPGPCPQLAEGC